MARSEARLSVSIWNDRDFLALSPGAQRMFMFLISQSDLAHDGVIALRERRWSKSAANLARADVERDLAELHDARFVVVDEDAEELLIRSFIRRDKVYRQPNVLRAAADHLDVVTSPAILAALADELRRVLDAPDIHKDSRPIVEAMLKGIGNPSGNPSPEPPPGLGDETPAPTPADHLGDKADAKQSAVQLEDKTGESDSARTTVDVSAARMGSRNPSPNPSGNPSAGTPGERGVVTVVSRGVSPYPVPRSPYPNPSALAPLDAGEPLDAEILDSHPTATGLFAVPDPEPTPGTDVAVVETVNAGVITKQWIDFCVGNNLKLTNTAIKRYARGIKDALGQNFTEEVIKRALAEMMRDRVVSRPSLFDNYLIRAQQGPERPPARMSRTEESITRHAPAGLTAGDLVREALTRPA